MNEFMYVDKKITYLSNKLCMLIRIWSKFIDTHNPNLQKVCWVCIVLTNRIKLYDSYKTCPKIDFECNSIPKV